jgi:hypothetical protein
VGSSSRSTAKENSPIAIIRDGDKTSCVRVVDGKAVRTPIHLGLADATRTEVRSGLEDDEQVVATNAASHVDGQPVEVSGPSPGGSR